MVGVLLAPTALVPPLGFIPGPPAWAGGWVRPQRSWIHSEYGFGGHFSIVVRVGTLKASGPCHSHLTELEDGDM